MTQQDTRDADTILATIEAEARAAWQAELDFFEWRADHESTMSAEFFRRYAEWVERCEPYARKRPNCEDLSRAISKAEGGPKADPARDVMRIVPN